MGLVANDDAAKTRPGQPVTVNVLANDTLDGAPVSLDDLAGLPAIVSPPAVGAAVVNGDGTVTYTPPSDFSGTVEIEYEIEAETAPCAVAAVGWFGEGSFVFVNTPPPWWDTLPVGGEFTIFDGGAGDVWFLAATKAGSNGGWMHAWGGEGAIPMNETLEAVIRANDTLATDHCCHFTWDAA